MGEYYSLLREQQETNEILIKNQEEIINIKEEIKGQTFLTFTIAIIVMVMGLEKFFDTILNNK